MSTPAATTTAVRRGHWRWFVALVATVLLVVSGSGLVAFAASGDGEGKGPRFVPAGAPIYVEARADMPGGQDQAIAAVLSAFPGFADTAAFDMKLDQALDGAVGQATGGALTYSGDLKSVITGEMGLALLDLEAAMMGGDPDFLLGIAISDPEGAAAIVGQLTADMGLTEQSYGDTTILAGPGTAVAVHDEWVLLGATVDQVTAGIDALEGTSPNLADDPGFQAAFARLPSARLGGAYVDFDAFGSLLEAATQMAAGQTGMAMPTTDLLAQLPKDMAASLSAESDRLHLHAFMTAGDALLPISVGESDLATLYPADTQVYVETRDLGTMLQTVLEQVSQLMAAQAESGAMDESGMAALEMFLAEDGPIITFLGVPLTEFVGFIGDAAVGGGLTSDGLSLGMAAVVDDEALAQERVDRLMSIVVGFGSEAGVTVEETTVGETPATLITLPAEAMAGSGLPIDNTVTVAVADGHVLVGLGDFVEVALTQLESESLAASAGYLDALAGDTPNSGVMFANISSLLTVLDPMLTSMVPEWAQMAPYATGLDRLVVVGTADDEVLSSRMTVIVDR